jgi:hypothetical protein
MSYIQNRALQLIRYLEYGSGRSGMFIHGVMSTTYMWQWCQKKGINKDCFYKILNYLIDNKYLYWNEKECEYYNNPIRRKNETSKNNR